MNNNKRPYFIWDYDLTEADVRRILRGEEGEFQRRWLIARILESAKFEDVWKYLKLSEVASVFSELRLKKPVQRAWQRALKVWGAGAFN